MISNEQSIDHNFGILRRQIRLIMLLDAAEKAGLTPLSILRLHMLTYLSNVLAPVWDMPVLEGKVLKRRGGPFYPVLQHDLDRLVGMGIVMISGLGHDLDEMRHWRLEGSYTLNSDIADRLQPYILKYESEQQLAGFFQELAFALSYLGDEELDLAMMEDATYMDPMTDVGNVVDFAEWQDKNYSANAANYFENLLPYGTRATPGEKLHLYIRHIHARISGDGK